MLKRALATAPGAKPRRVNLTTAEETALRADWDAGLTDNRRRLLALAFERAAARRIAALVPEWGSSGFTLRLVMSLWPMLTPPAAGSPHALARAVWVYLIDDALPHVVAAVDAAALAEIDPAAAAPFGPTAPGWPE